MLRRMYKIVQNLVEGLSNVCPCFGTNCLKRLWWDCKKSNNTYLEEKAKELVQGLQDVLFVEFWSYEPEVEESYNYSNDWLVVSREHNCEIVKEFYRYNRIMQQFDFISR